jgi:hypothetical protein
VSGDQVTFSGGRNHVRNSLLGIIGLLAASQIAGCSTAQPGQKLAITNTWNGSASVVEGGPHLTVPGFTSTRPIDMTLSNVKETVQRNTADGNTWTMDIRVDMQLADDDAKLKNLYKSVVGQEGRAKISDPDQTTADDVLSNDFMLSVYANRVQSQIREAATKVLSGYTDAQLADQGTVLEIADILNQGRKKVPAQAPVKDGQGKDMKAGSPEKPEIENIVEKLREEGINVKLSVGAIRPPQQIAAANAEIAKAKAQQAVQEAQYAALQNKVKAEEQLTNLYRQNPALVQLEIAKINKEAVESAAAKGAQIVIIQGNTPAGPVPLVLQPQKQ